MPWFTPFRPRLPQLPLPPWLAKPLLWLVVAVGLIYYPVGMLIVHKVDDAPEFIQNVHAPERGSVAVAAAAALMEREINRHWVPNDPWFFPGGALVRMDAYQRGIASGVARFTLALSDQLSRTRGSSASDADVQRALGLLNYPPTVWFYDMSVSWLPTASSESQYRAGAEALEGYNTRVAAGSAVYDRRADNLMDALERFTADLGASSGAIDAFVRERSIFSFMDAARLYYETKGKLYAYYILMRALEQDFAPVIQEKQLGPVWDQATESLKEGMELSNWVVLNADADNQILPSHLTSQGFYVLRARTQLHEIMNILLK